MPIEKERLLQLAEHLETKPVHKEFNLNYFNRGGTDASMCGTAGCALGECPFVFTDWYFGRTMLPKPGWDKVIAFIKDEHGITKEYEGFDAAKLFFGIDSQYLDLLFLAGESHLEADYEMDGDDKIWKYPVYRLPNGHIMKPQSQFATAKEVAAQIKEFVQNY